MHSARLRWESLSRSLARGRLTRQIRVAYLIVTSIVPAMKLMKSNSVRVNYGAPRNSGTSAILDFEGATRDELDQAPGVLVGDLDLSKLRQARNDWNPVYGLHNRYPAAYKRQK